MLGDMLDFNRYWVVETIANSHCVQGIAYEDAYLHLLVRQIFHSANRDIEIERTKEEILRRWTWDWVSG